MDNIYSMHPLVHSWSRDSMSHEQQQAGSFFAHGLLSSSITFVFASEDYAFRQTLVPHIKAVNRHDALLGTPMAYNDEQYTNYTLVFYEAGYWKEAEQLQIQVLETRKRVLGEEHPDMLTSMANLVSTYRNQGWWVEAEQLEVQVSETRKRVLGEEHPDTLTSMANLVSTYWNQGRWVEAEQLEVQVLETRKRVLGEEHPDTLTSMANLASTYLNQGRWTEAEQLNVQVLKTRMRVLGERHPYTLTSMANLASMYGNQGQWKEAEQLDIQVSETRKGVLDLNKALVHLDIPEQAPKLLSYPIDLAKVTDSPDIPERAPEPLSYSIDPAEVTDSPDVPEQAPELLSYSIDLGLCTVARPRRTDGTVCAGTVSRPVKKWTWIYQDLLYPPLAMAGTILAHIFDGRIRVTYDPYGQL